MGIEYYLGAWLGMLHPACVALCNYYTIVRCHREACTSLHPVRSERAAAVA